MNICQTTIALAGLVAGSAGAQTSRLSIAPARPEPGAVVRLTLTEPAPRPDAVVSIRGSMAGEPLHFLPSAPGTWHAIGAVPVDATGTLLADAQVRHASGKVESVRARLTLPKLPPPVAQPLAVDSSFTRPLDSATAARVDRENARAREVGKRAHDSPLMWTGSFLRPRTSAITSEFGSGRLFNGRMTSRHLGVDFRGAVGEPVRAANRGVVALVDNFFLAGNVVYVDHGGGLVTAYFHLSKTLVSVGDTVTRGKVIGLVGATGRVTGPHLHWAARYGATTVNPLDLVSLNRNWYGASLSRSQTRPTRTSGAR
ncbi:MAG TPA: M23 family metallopeptidase [Gemmatimonadaceae bacterium]|nr:M23 family metallopeptidase [Gemmatimonadaceae bacterium]